MVERERILVICNSFFSSGAEQSLFDLLKRTNKKYAYFIIFPTDSQIKPEDNREYPTYYLPLRWFYYTLNPIRLFQFTYSIIKSSFYLVKIIKDHQIDFICANTIKACVYAVVAKLFTKKKIVWQVRDNIKQTILHKILTKNSDVIVSISKHIDAQIASGKHRKHLVYGGLDVKKWTLKTISDNTLKSELGLPNDTRLVTQIGQLTRWKNHSDFIKAASLILKTQPDIHFLIIGDDLSSREGKYKTELIKLVDELRLNSFISFLGNRQDVKELLNQIDILIHPAINEPFGRVLIEAMAMEKPVIAYNCGGPREIIVNNKTGYLVEPYHYKEIAEKAICLLGNEKLRSQFGKAGRKRVIEKFTLERYVKEMKDLFDHV